MPVAEGRSGRNPTPALLHEVHLFPEGDPPVGRVAAASTRSPCQLYYSFLFFTHLHTRQGSLFCEAEGRSGGRPQDAKRPPSEARGAADLLAGRPLAPLA